MLEPVSVSATNDNSGARSGSVNMNSATKQPASGCTHQNSRSGRAPMWRLSKFPSVVSSDVTTPAQLSPSGSHRLESRRDWRP